MSYIYNKEPPTHGKVLVKTTLGDLDIELWSKEAPLACRNFVQLCLEGYYNSTIFHRIVPEFITQGGDPTGTGEGGESVYGHSFKDEFHSRLRFVRRGLVGCASAERNDNGSQFFITLGRTDELTKKHTLFGKVTGDTHYNLVKFNDVQTDSEDRPLNPIPRITRTEVLQNPFDDIVPRVSSRGAAERKAEEVKSQSKATKNFSLLSFGEEAEEDEEETSVVSKKLKLHSSHDVLKDDTKLSSLPALDPTATSSHSEGGDKKDELGDGEEEEGGGGGGGGERGEEEDEEWKEYTKERERRLKLMEDTWEDEDTRKRKRKEQLQKESEALRNEIRDSAKRKRLEAKAKLKKEEDKWIGVPAPVRALREEQEAYRQKKLSLAKGGNRELQTLELLGQFRTKMFTARLSKRRKEEDDEEKKEEEEEEHRGEKEEEKEEEEEEENERGTNTDIAWLKHKLEFEDERIVVAKDANRHGEDTYDIYDPRNPINKRRREEGVAEAKLSRENAIRERTKR